MIAVKLTNGFGNNLFQYNAGRLLADFLHQDIYGIVPSVDYYAIPCLEKLGFNLDHSLPPTYITVGDQQYSMSHHTDLRNNNIVLDGYFEDYTIFKDNIDKIKQWYPKIDQRDDKDLVIHFRAGDRLFYKNEFHYKPSVEKYINAMQQFDFSRLYIVTDMPKWDYINREQLEQMKFHYDVPQDQRGDPQMSVDYFNSFIDNFSKFNPVVKKRTIYEDFNFIRSFNNILFEHGTLGWWAAALSNAKRVGVYGPWRRWKGNRNKNLSNMNLPTWFKWE